jgi:uncharacterized protein (TIGR02058 family)
MHASASPRAKNSARAVVAATANVASMGGGTTTRGGAMRQVILIELGMGVDLQGQDVTKAAVKAVRDAIGRVYAPGLGAVLGGGKRLDILVRLGAPPAAGTLDEAAVRAALPHGRATIEVAPGGLLVPNGQGDGGSICVVTAAVEVAVAD